MSLWYSFPERKNIWFWTIPKYKLAKPIEAKKLPHAKLEQWSIFLISADKGKIFRQCFAALSGNDKRWTWFFCIQSLYFTLIIVTGTISSVWEYKRIKSRKSSQKALHHRSMKEEEFGKKKSKAEVFTDSDAFIKRAPGIPCMYKRWRLI